VGGETKAKTYSEGGNVVNEYVENDAEKALRKQREKYLSDYLGKVNTFTPEFYQNLNNQLEAQTKQGVKLINETYNPMFSALKTDIAGRFGSFANSSFLDGLNKIEAQRVNAVEKLAQDVLLNQVKLESDQTDKNYSFLNMLNGMQNDYLDNVYKATGTASSEAKTANAANNTAYQTALANYYKQNTLNSKNNDQTAEMMKVAAQLAVQYGPEIAAAFSDRNLKKNITPIKDEDKILERLKAYKYEYDRSKSSALPEGEKIGLMAQEVEKVLPQAVTQTPIGKAVDYAQIIPVLVGALNELSAKIDRLQK
jgi:hypothetical protein